MIPREGPPTSPPALAARPAPTAPTPTPRFCPSRGGNKRPTPGPTRVTRGASGAAHPSHKPTGSSAHGSGGNFTLETLGVYEDP